MNYLNNYINTNLVVCIYKNGEIFNYSSNCVITDCSNDWRSKRKRINSDNQCIDNCSSINYNYEYNSKCYYECPSDTRIVKYYDYLCANYCTIDEPFFLINELSCVTYCDINDIINKLCVLHYFENNNSSTYTNATLMLNNILKNIYQNIFNPGIVNKSRNILIYESGVYFNIAMIESYNIFYECKDIIKSNYNISIFN